MFVTSCRLITSLTRPSTSLSVPSTSVSLHMKKSKNVSPHAVILLLLLMLPLVSTAATKTDADSLYAAEHYQQAAQCYESVLKNGVSADLYYNLGNCYYRMDDMTRAVLNYERALLLSPGDRDVRLNLQMARSKTIDKIVPESEMFFCYVVPLID